MSLASSIMLALKSAAQLQAGPASTKASACLFDSEDDREFFKKLLPPFHEDMGYEKTEIGMDKDAEDTPSERPRETSLLSLEEKARKYFDKRRRGFVLKERV